jgi:hypothetical protein
LRQSAWVPTLAGVARRRTEKLVFWGLRALGLAAALAVALAAPAIRPVETWLGSEGWARAAEALLLLFLFRVALLLLGLQRGNFAFLGMSLGDVPGIAQEHSVRAAEDRLSVRIGAVREALVDVVRRVRVLEQRVDALEETRFGGG